MTKIGINGFGRIGRFVFRASTKREWKGVSPSLNLTT